MAIFPHCWENNNNWEWRSYFLRISKKNPYWHFGKKILRWKHNCLPQPIVSLEKIQLFQFSTRYFQIQKRIVSSETIRGNMVSKKKCPPFEYSKTKICSTYKILGKKYLLVHNNGGTFWGLPWPEHVQTRGQCLDFLCI